MLGSILDFLSDPETRSVLTRIGSGLVTLGAAGWAVLRFVLESGRDKKDGGEEAAAKVSRGNETKISFEQTEINNAIPLGHLIVVLSFTAGIVLLTGAFAGKRIHASDCANAIVGDVKSSVVIASGTDC